MYKKLITLFAAGSLALTLAACGNSNNSAAPSSAKNESHPAKVVKSSITASKNTTSSSTKAKGQTSQVTTPSKNKKSTAGSTAQNNSSSQVETNSQSVTNSAQSKQTQYKVVKSGSHSSVVKADNASSAQAQMTATDAKNIVKEHIINKLNDAGSEGRPRPNVPSMDEIDSYKTTQNGTNDWTVSGNGHTYHVTATAVTEQ